MSQDCLYLICFLILHNAPIVQRLLPVSLAKWAIKVSWLLLIHCTTSAEPPNLYLCNNSVTSDGQIYRSAENNSTVRVSMLLVEVEHVLQRELGANVSVHKEERRRCSRQDLVSEMVNATTCAQCCKLLQVSKHSTRRRWKNGGLDASSFIKISK